MSKFGIRPGHTNASCGAVSKRKENDVTRAVTPVFIDEMKKDHTVINVHPGESLTYPTELNQGVNIANSNNVDYFVSVHANVGGGTGAEVLLYSTNNAQMVAYANSVLKELEALGFKNRGIKVRPKLGELKNTKMPAMIIELFFLDNDKDIETYDKVGATSIGKALARGFGVNTDTQPTQPTKDITSVARDVINGKYGNGQDRINKLKAEGYDPNVVQAEVNRLLGASTPTKKSIDEIAKEVIRGDWGNGSDRKARLEKAGYNYNEVQKRVNQLL